MENETKEAKKGDCGKTPRVGNVGDSKPGLGTNLGRGRGGQGRGLGPGRGRGRGIRVDQE